MIIIRVLVFVLGLGLVATALLSAIRTFVLPRSAPDRIVRTVFLSVRAAFNLWLRRSTSYLERDRILAYYAPAGLIMLLPTWLALVLVGYFGMFWAIGAGSPYEAFRVSGSSLLTLGSFTINGWFVTALEFSEAMIGLILLSLLIAYLPTIYGAFSRREMAVALLEVRAGNPPSAVEMIKRFHRIHGLGALGEMWRTWEVWFVEVEESHSSLAALVFYRSPTAGHSWVSASGTILDAAALVNAVVDTPHNAQADLCLRAGYLALRKIGDYFGVDYDPAPGPTDPTSVTREEFDQVVAELARAGVPLVKDRERAWISFNGWRVNYDKVLLALAELTDAPAGLWMGESTRRYHLPPLFRVGKKNRPQ